MKTEELLTYQDNIQSLERFFSANDKGAFMFAIADDELLQKQVSNDIQFLLKGKHKNIDIFSWKTHAKPDLLPIAQLQSYLREHPQTHGLILTDLDYALQQAAFKNLLVQLNFGREALLQLHVPMLFWVNNRTLPRITQDAIDLYDQRASANLYFLFNPVVNSQELQANEYKAIASVKANKDISHLEARLRLLQQQLSDAEDQKLPPTAIANNIVLELLDTYHLIPGTESEMQRLLKQYDTHFNTENPDTLFTLASVYSKLNQINLAINTLLKAIQLYRKAALNNANRYNPFIAVTLNNLGILHRAKNEFLEAEEAYKEALNIYRSLSKINMQTYQPFVATTLNNLAVLHSDKNELSQSEEAYRQALNIYLSLAEIKPQTYLPYVANTLNNLANLQINKNEFPQAEEAYRQAMNIYRSLAETNPQTYLSDVAMTLNNFANLHRVKNEFVEAEEEYTEALEIYRSLASANPQTYLLSVAMTLYNLGALLKAKNEFLQAEEAYREALNIRRALAEVNPQTYLPDVAMTLNNLGNLHNDINEYPQAEEAYREALNIRRVLAEVNPQTYLPYVATTLNNLGILHSKKNDFTEAEEAYREALKIQWALAKINPQAYLPDVAMTAMNLSIFYLQSVPNKDKSLAFAKEALKAVLPFLEILPTAQKHVSTILKIVQHWGLDPEAFKKECIEEMQDSGK